MGSGDKCKFLAYSGTEMGRKDPRGWRSFYWAAGVEYRPAERDYIGLNGDYIFETRLGWPTLPSAFFSFFFSFLGEDIVNFQHLKCWSTL